MFKQQFVGVLTILVYFGFVENFEVIFEIDQVPKYYTPINDNIFIAGTFNGWSSNDENYKSIKKTHNTYRITLNLQAGYYEYKFTRGSWNKVETLDSNGNDITNRNIQVNSDMKISIKIQNWMDMKGIHTAVGNTNIIDTNFPYPQFNRTKRIWIYLPPNYYTSIQKYPVIYMHDGQNLFDKLYSNTGEWNIDETMESLYAQGKQTSIVVGLDTLGIGVNPDAERLDELTPFTNNTYGGGGGDKYIDFLVHTIKPYVDKNFRTLPGREYTGISGSSLGGFMSIYGGLKFMDTFSKLGIFSPSLWFSEKMFEFVANTTAKYDDMKISFVCGGSEYASMKPNMLRMVDLVKSKGYKNVRSLIPDDGVHQEWFWGREFPSTYEWLYL